MVTVDAGSGESAARRAVQQELVLEALAAGESYGQAGARAGVTGKTVQRWMRDPGFSRQLSDRRGARLSEVTGLLLDATTDAVRVIRQECQHAEKASDRLRAAALLLSMATRMREKLDVEARVAEIEVFLGSAAAPVDLTDGGGAS